MELPIARQSYLPSAEALVRALRRADEVLVRTAAEETELAGATVFSNLARPDIAIVNRATQVRIPEGMTAEAVLSEIDAHFASRGLRCLQWEAVDPTWPAPLREALTARGCREEVMQLLLLDRPVPLTQQNSRLQIIPGRAAYAELRRLLVRIAKSRSEASDDFAARLADTQIDHHDEARLESLLGRLNGTPVGLVNVLTLGNIGVITRIATDPDFLDQNVASTLLSHALEFCRRVLFENVVLGLTADDPAQSLSQAAGFKPITTFSIYRRP
ncbi:MAG: GNAT family N-acetyltransferase [Phycisphaeraceae bacterium]|nr:GNAT family N-acetyltransferase [Phycisphaeraceae bacterium]